MTLDLPPGYTIAGSAIRGPGKWRYTIDPLDIDDPVPPEDHAWAAWQHYLAALDLPDPVPADLCRGMCRIYGMCLEDQPRSQGQRAAARALHLAERTIRKWCAGESAPAWAAMELLRRMIAAEGGYE